MAYQMTLAVITAARVGGASGLWEGGVHRFGVQIVGVAVTIGWRLVGAWNALKLVSTLRTNAKASTSRRRAKRRGNRARSNFGLSLRPASKGDDPAVYTAETFAF